MLLPNRTLSQYLEGKMPETAGLLDTAKIGYRPYICPFNELLECIPEGASVLDIGCGNGMFLALAAHFKKPARLGGLEVSPSLIENARALLATETKAPVFLETFNGRDLPASIHEYSHIFMIDVLHHIPPKAQLHFLHLLHEKMRPGSQLILKDIDRLNLLSYWNKFHDLLIGGGIGHEWTALYAKRILQSFGFRTSRIKRKIMFLYPHYTIIAKKEENPL